MQKMKVLVFLLYHQNIYPMRKLLLTAILFSSVIILGASNTADLFRIDESKIAAEMADLTAIENRVINEQVTLSQLLAENDALAERALLPSYGAASMASADGPPLGIPSFVWGFCLGIIGIAIVYFVTESRGETTKALWGCIAWGVIYAVLYLAVWGTAF